MTATTRRTLSRTTVLAGIVTAGTAALALPFAPTASADDTGHAVERTAERTDAPAAFAPEATQDVLGKAPTTGNDDGGDDDRDHAQDQDREDREDAPERAKESRADKPEREEPKAPATGRGAQYSADGSLVTIDKHEQPTPEPASDADIDRWINQALDVLEKNDIPATYEGIHRNLMRESSGDPLTINMWDTNAEKNIPSKGLLQVIDPTFEQYHVEGTSTDIYDPVANIAAACNYAADRYGSMDNVDSAY